MKKVLLDFFPLAVAAKVAFYRNVIAKLTGNATYPTPDKPLADAKAAVDKLEAAQLAARDGGRAAISAMHDREAEADAIFRVLAAYVDRIAQGDETKILTSGFHVSQPHGSIQKPELSVQDGSNSGSVKLVAKAVPGAGAYIWQMAKGTAPADEAGWQTVGHSTGASYEVTGLAPASICLFRVAAITPSGVTDYMGPVTKVVV